MPITLFDFREEYLEERISCVCKYAIFLLGLDFWIPHNVCFG